jgi:stage II sporulation protein D
MDDPKGSMTKITDANLDAFLDAKESDAWCAKGKFGKGRFRWNEKITAAELTTRISADYPEIGRVKNLTAKQRGVSGRIGVLTVTGDKGSVDVAGDLKIRRMLGGLKSTLFELTKDGDTFHFRGAGFGHGVGMCQMGAIGMANAGKTHKQILGHYYRGTHIHKLY